MTRQRNSALLSVWDDWRKMSQGSDHERVRAALETRFVYMSRAGELRRTRRGLVESFKGTCYARFVRAIAKKHDQERCQRACLHAMQGIMGAQKQNEHVHVVSGCAKAISAWREAAKEGRKDQRAADGARRARARRMLWLARVVLVCWKGEALRSIQASRRVQVCAFHA